MASRTIAFSPVRVEPEILEMFLQCLNGVAEHSPGVEFWFYDDNVDDESRRLLSGFVSTLGERARVVEPIELRPTDYSRAGISHNWSHQAVTRISTIKNAAIAEFLETDASHLFLLDADVLVRPETVDHLQAQDADVVSAVYWTRFGVREPYLPNVWDFDSYGFDGPQSVIRLRDPGHYIVGGLGACTLLHRKVLEAGVDFSAVPIVRMWGEDRSFCVRATVHGFELIADTCLPPFHVYRADLLEEAQAFVAKGMPTDWFKKKWLTDGWEFAVSRLIGRLGAAWKGQHDHRDPGEARPIPLPR